MNVFKSLKNNFVTLYNPKDEKGVGRLCMTLNGILSSLYSNLVGGAFYTGFLLLYGINVVSIGVLTFIPSLMALMNIFSPYILERFPKRKWLLAIVRTISNAINILGITFLPVIVKQETARMVGLVALVALANAINNLIGSGYNVWHANFLEEDVRASYFLTNSCIASLFSYVLVLVVSVMTDKVAEDPARQLSILTIVRIIAFIISIADVLVLCIPKEYEYKKTSEKIKFTDIFVKSFSNRPFILSMLILFVFSFSRNLPAATANAWVINEVGVSYTLMNGINATYFLFFIMFGSMWKKFIAKFTWFKAFAIVSVCEATTYLMTALITKGNAAWLYPTVRLIQHVFGVVVNTIVASIPYINLPESDRTNYMSFYVIVSSGSAFLGMSFGTLFIKLVGEGTLFSLFGLEFCGTQVLYLGNYVFEFVTALIIMLFIDVITPKGLYETRKK